MGLRKRIGFIGLLVLLLVLGLTACSGDGDKGGTKKFYDGSVSIDLPGGWTTEEGDLSSGSGQVMLYSSSKISKAKSPDDLPKNAALGALFVGQVYDFELEGGPEASLRSYLELEGGLPEDAEFETLEINGNPAALYTGMEEQNGLEGYRYDVGIFYDGKIRVYLLMYGFKGETNTFDKTFKGLADTVVIDVEKLSSQLEGQ